MGERQREAHGGHDPETSGHHQGPSQVGYGRLDLREIGRQPDHPATFAGRGEGEVEEPPTHGGAASRDPPDSSRESRLHLGAVRVALHAGELRARHVGVRHDGTVGRDQGDPDVGGRGGAQGQALEPRALLDLQAPRLDLLPDQTGPLPQRALDAGELPAAQPPLGEHARDEHHRRHQPREHEGESELETEAHRRSRFWRATHRTSLTLAGRAAAQLDRSAKR